jgi:aconitate hydratase
VGMGIIPLQFEGNKTVEFLGLTGEETYDIVGFRERLASKFAIGRTVAVVATAADGRKITFEAKIRIDTPQEILYYEHGGILQYVLRQLAGK